jgi:hypothetical protein
MVQRVIATSISLLFGFCSGMLTADAGGSNSRAPAAVLIMALTLGGVGLLIGLVFGWFDELAAAIVVGAGILASYYAGTWVDSSFHSTGGDALFMTVSSIPLVCGGAIGFVLGLLHSPSGGDGDDRSPAA